jgi:hypothetical protein
MTKPEVEGVLGGLGDDAVKGYYKNLGYWRWVVVPLLQRECSFG